MKRALPITLAAALVLIGPVMYVFSRAHTLNLAMARIAIGETSQQVTAALGPPQERRQRSPPAAVDLEYRYTVWPLRSVWVVGFRHGRVVETAER